MRAIPIDKQYPKSIARTIPTSRPPLKSIVRSIPIDSQCPKSIFQPIPVNRKSPKLIVQTRPIDRQSPKSTARTIKIHCALFYKLLLIIHISTHGIGGVSKRPISTYKHIIHT